MNDDERDELLTLVEVAALLRKPQATLYAWRNRNLGPRGFKVGRSILYRRSVVDAWVDEQARADPSYREPAQ